MPWMPLAENDLQNSLSAQELDAFNSTNLESGQADRSEQIVAWVVSLVRGRVAAFPQNRNLMDSNSANIPAELYGAAIEIARYKLLSSFPQGKVFLDDARIASYKDANKQLDDTAKGLIAIEQPVGSTFDASRVLYGSQDMQGNDCPEPPLNFGFWH